TPNVEAIEVYVESESSYEHDSVRVADGSFKLRVPKGRPTFVAVRERFQPDATLWPDASAQSWCVLGHVLTSREVNLGELELVVPRGSLALQLRRPGGAPFEAGSRLVLSFVDYYPDLRLARDLMNQPNANAITLPVPSDGAALFDGIPSGNFTLAVFVPGQKSTRLQPIEVRVGSTTALELTT